MKNIIYSTFFLIFMFTAFGQEKSDKSGDKKLQKLAYVDAIKTYERIVKKGYVNAEICQKIGDSYYFNANYIKAAEWYKQLFDLSNQPNPEYYYRYALTLKSSGKIEESDKLMKEYVLLKPLQQRAELLKSNKDYKELIALNSNRFELQTLSINSKNSDFGTAFYKDQVVFTSSRETNGIHKRSHTWTGLPFTSLYSASVDADGSVSNPVKFANKLNSKFNESTPVFTKDGNTVYFTRNNFLKGKKGKDSLGIVLLKIYSAQKNKKNEWENIKALPFNSDEYQVAHPALSPDEKTLYFVSDMPGSFGKSDLYQVDINSDGTFGVPINMGKAINTEGRETFPFVSELGILYFASDGRPGLGGLDVFQVDLKNIEKKHAVLNVGEPINSDMDDFSYCINDNTKRGFYTSNREGGLGNDDIYGFLQLKPIIFPCEQLLAGTIFDIQSNEIIPEASVTLYSNDQQVISSIITDKNGQFDFGFVDCGSNFLVRATKVDYSTDEKRVAIPIITGMTKTTLAIEKTTLPLITGTDLSKIFHIKEIYFDLDKWFIRKDAAIELAKIMDVLIEYPKMSIAIGSHTDSRQTHSYNDKLSDLRSKSTRNWLINHGISPNRLTAKGYGENKLVNNCKDGIECTEEQHQANRRSEFIIISL